MIPDANLNKPQREAVLKNWKALHNFVEQNCHLSITDFVNILPDEYTVEKVETMTNDKFKYTSILKMPYRYCIYESPLLDNRLVLQADLLVFNEISNQWEYCDYTGL